MPPESSLSLLDVQPGPDPQVAAPTNASIPTLAGRFEPVALPAKLPAIVSVTGRNPSDVWLLAKSNAVIHWDGIRTNRRGAPRCHADSCCGRLVSCAAKPEACKPDCSLGYLACATPVEFAGLRLEDRDVVAVATVYTGGMRGALIEARLRKGFRCEQSSDDLIHPGSQASGDGAHASRMSVADLELTLEGPAWLVNPLGGTSLVYEGRRVPMPEDVRGDVGLVTVAPDDLWLWQARDGHIWRGNGVTWEPLPTGVGQLHDMWVGEGMVWGLAVGEAVGGEFLVRWDLAAGGWTWVDVPGATKVLQAGEGRFWVTGATDVYRWDGHALGHLDAPLDIADAWLDSSGALWLVGGSRTATVPGAEAPAPAAAAFRLLVGDEEKGP